MRWLPVSYAVGKVVSVRVVSVSTVSVRIVSANTVSQCTVSVRIVSNCRDTSPQFRLYYTAKLTTTAVCNTFIAEPMYKKYGSLAIRVKFRSMT